jgi:hypothetical protein
MCPTSSHKTSLLLCVANWGSHLIKNIENCGFISSSKVENTFHGCFWFIKRFSLFCLLFDLLVLGGSFKV